MAILRILGLILVLAASQEAIACSCWGAEGFAGDDSPIAKKVFSSPDLILVHARVRKVSNDNSADIEVI